MVFCFEAVALRSLGVAGQDLYNLYMYHVYILYSKKLNKHYVGYTPRNIEIRLKEHNQSMNDFTKTGMPWELVWYCSFSKKEKAESFEKYLKHGSGHAFAKKRFL